MKKDPDHNTPCPFCRTEASNILASNDTAFAVHDTSPVTEGHVLVLPFRHCQDFFSLTREELSDCYTLIEQVKENLLLSDPRITGFNIGVNCGKDAGQTIFHVHIHLIPRRKNDTPNPRGGVRGVIPEKMNY